MVKDSWTCLSGTLNPPAIFPPSSKPRSAAAHSNWGDRFNLNLQQFLEYSLDFILFCSVLLINTFMIKCLSKISPPSNGNRVSPLLVSRIFKVICILMFTMFYSLFSLITFIGWMFQAFLMRNERRKRHFVVVAARAGFFFGGRGGGVVRPHRAALTRRRQKGKNEDSFFFNFKLDSRKSGRNKPKLMRLVVLFVVLLSMSLANSNWQ